MSVFEPNSRHLRKVLIFCFHLKKTAAEAYRMLWSTYGEATLSKRTCYGWFQYFKTGDVDVEDWYGGGKKKIFEDSELEALFHEDSCQTQEQLAKSSGVTQQFISKCLKAMGMIQKQGNWVPYELKPRDVDFAACQRSGQCCKAGENLLGNAEMGGLTPPAVLSRRYFFRLPFVSIDGTQPGSSAFPLLWKSQKMDRLMNRLKRRIVFSRWYSTIARKIEKCSS